MTSGPCDTTLSAEGGQSAFCVNSFTERYSFRQNVSGAGGGCRLQKERLRTAAHVNVSLQLLVFMGSGGAARRRTPPHRRELAGTYRINAQVCTTSASKYGSWQSHYIIIEFFLDKLSHLVLSARFRPVSEIQLRIGIVPG